MATYNSTKFLSLPQQVNKNKKDIEALQEVEINLNNYIPKTDKGEPLGVATLDANGKVPTSQVPVNPGNFLPLSGGTMAGPIDMDGQEIKQVGGLETSDLKVEQIENPTNQPIYVLSDIDLDNTKKIINATKGTQLNDGATIANINDHDDSPFSHPDIRNSISALQGAWVLRGIVEWPTIKVTPIRLDSRIQQLMNRTPQMGDVLQDLDSHEWYFNGSVWDDFGQLHIGLASPTSDGLMSIAQYNKMNELPDRAQIYNLVDTQAERIDTLIPIVADKEDEVNKVTQFVDPNNVTFPTTLAVFELVDGIHDELKEDIIDVNNNLTNYINDEIQTLEDEVNLIPSQIDTKIKDVGLDTPIEELENQSLREVFENGNLVVNGDFSNGTTGWVFLKGGINDGEYVYSSNLSYDVGALQEINLEIGAYYFVIKARNASSNIPYADISNSVGSSIAIDNSNMEYKSSLFVKSVSEIRYITLGYFTVIDTEGNVYFDDISLYHLTSLGISSLTVEEMDYWFNVYQSIKEKSTTQYVLEALNKRPLIAQEEWITPTLTGATSTYIKYRKDNFGTIVIEGNLNIATAGTNLTLPIGYRPLFNYTVGNLMFNIDGTVVSSATGNESISIRFTGGQ